MKKHFLILMLMALLPLSGWAAIDISTSCTFTIKKTSIGYTGAAVDVQATLKQNDVEDPLTLNTDYELLYFADGASEALAEAPVNTGTYQVQAKGIEANGYTGTSQKITFNITKGTIEAANITTQPVGADGLTYDGTEKTLIGTAGAIAEAYGKVQYSLDGVNYQDALPKGLNAGTYNVYWKVNGEPNYNDYTPAAAASPIEVVIAPKPVAGTQVVVITGVPEAAAYPTYNGNDLSLTGITATIKASDAADAEVIATYTNPVIKYYTNEARTAGEATAVTNANTYYLKISEPAEGANYSFTDATKAYQIKPMNLIISVGANEKPYDHTAFAATEATYVPGALAAGDATATIAGYALTPVTAFAATAGNYAVKANIDGLTIKKTVDVEGVATVVDVTANYNIINPERNWTITKLPLTVKASDKEIASGAAPSSISASLSVDVEGAYEEFNDAEHPETPTYTEKATIAGYFTAAWNGDVIADADAAITEPGAIANAIKATLTEADPALLANYEYEVDATTEAMVIGKGTLTVQGKNFTIVPSISTVQYGTEVAKAYNAYNADYTPATVDEDALAYQYRVKGATDWIDWNDTNKPTAINEYEVRFKEGVEIVGTGSNVGGTATPAASVFKITQKAITVNIADIELWNGATKTDLNNKLTEAVIANVANDWDALLVGEEEINIVLNFKAATGLTIGDEASDYAITFGTTWVDEAVAIEAALVNAEGTADLNYAVTFTGGKLKQVNYAALTLILDDSDADLETKIAEAATVCATNPDARYNVLINFANRNSQTINTKYGTWKAGYWNTMVLPFDISVGELSNALGYAVVNVIDKDGATRDAKGTPTFRFRLIMKGGYGESSVTDNDVIPANHPFVVKIADDIKLTEVVGDVTVDYYYDFGERVIKAAEGLSVEAGLGCNYIGTYKTTAVGKGSEYAGKGRFLPGDYDSSWIVTSKSEWNIVPFAAFIDMTTLSEAEARNAVFIMEELDGTTTAIRSIEAEDIQGNANVKAEGMYNLKGMKLNSVPTQKGVYIKDGKKFIVK